MGHKHHKPPPIQNWDPTSVQPVTGGGPQSTSPTPPSVPGGGNGGHGTSVDTPSLKLFANNIGLLEQPLRDALRKLTDMKPVATGGFHQASQIRTKICGQNGGGGLQDGYSTVLKNIIEAVVDTKNAMLKLASDYENTEDQNNMKASALKKAMGDVATDLNSIGTAGSGLGGGSGS